MKFNILKTRRGKLEDKISKELVFEKPKIETILKAVDEYEKDNVDTIEKLRKDKTFDTKRINGALRQSIDAHGPITKLLIGSATKRIYGALLDRTNAPTNGFTEFQIIRVIIECILVIAVIMLALK